MNKQGARTKLWRSNNLTGGPSFSLGFGRLATVNVLDSDDVVKALLANIVQDRGRLKVEPQDLEGQGTRSRFYPIAYIVARSRGAVDWFVGVQDV